MSLRNLNSQPNTHTRPTASHRAVPRTRTRCISGSLAAAHDLIHFAALPLQHSTECRARQGEVH